MHDGIEEHDGHATSTAWYRYAGQWLTLTARGTIGRAPDAPVFTLINRPEIVRRQP
jgi:hypothetical protein